MEKKVKFEKRLVIIVLVAVICLFVMAIRLTNQGDDQFFLNQISKKFDNNIVNFLVDRYQTWSSRTFIELALIVSVKFRIIWKVITTVCLVMISVLLPFMFNDNKHVDSRDIIFSTSLLALVPIALFHSAGWIATTTNYLWVMASAVFSFMVINRILQKRHINKLLYALSVISFLYAVNQEQMAVILFGFMTFAILVSKFELAKVLKLVPYILINISSLIYMALSPGNKIRAIQETKNDFPSFENFSILKKIELGYSSTLHQLFLNNSLVMLLLLLFLVIITVKKNKNIYHIILSCIPLLSFIIIPNSNLLSFDLLLKKFNETGTTISFSELSSWGPDLLLFGLLICTALTIYYVFDNGLDGAIAVIILFAAILGRMILGFSGSIWLSGDRTYFFTYILINILVIYIYNKNKHFITSSFIGLVAAFSIVVMLSNIVQTIY